MQADQTMSLAEIAAACGFYDQAHLNRHFRQAFGETPSACSRERKYPKL
jgi:transcriptional regulator GlxA family with amidase domain